MFRSRKGVLRDGLTQSELKASCVPVWFARLVASTFGMLPKPTADLSSVCQLLSRRQYCEVLPDAMAGSLPARPGTVGEAAVPPRSPAS